jgi:peptide chain release factor 2
MHKPKGGQHTNNIETALIVTDVRTGIFVRVDKLGSLTRSKEAALEFLSHKVGTVNDDWDFPVITVVQDPYRLVKDNRTGREEEDVDAYLAGQLEEFMT